MLHIVESAKPVAQVMADLEAAVGPGALRRRHVRRLRRVWAPGPKAFHMVQLLEIALPGFRWLSVGSFFLGLVESFLYGAYTGLVFVPIYNFVLRRYR